MTKQARSLFAFVSKIYWEKLGFKGGYIKVGVLGPKGNQNFLMAYAGKIIREVGISLSVMKVSYKISLDVLQLLIKLILFVQQASTRSLCFSFSFVRDLQAFS
ncbi:hypothetical protein Fot_37373 [Forsythia ovata]|uniref:Uncharacterized protein n=1 Tax=Forsythia ovata TaxID=205694 RepID=A0ABD1RYT8_9LAMI